MSHVLHHLVHQHDLLLTALAALLCAFSSVVGIDLLHRTRRERGTSQLLWFMGSGLVLAMGIWSTHFVAMLAYDPGLAVGFTAVPTVLSAVAGLSIMGISLSWIATRPKPGIMRSAAAGVGVFIGVGTLHYVGMSGLAVEGRMEWDVETIVASVLVGALFGTLGLIVFGRWHGFAGRTAAAALITAGVATLHFTGMGALSVVPDATVSLPDSTIAKEWLAAGAAVSMVTVMVLGLAGRALDYILAKDERIAYMARHDMLTGLINRDHLLAELDLVLEDARASGAEVAIHFVDLDRFKEVNDCHGHEAGDLVLVEAARRLRAAAGPNDIVARIGGDEMMVVQRGCGPEAAAASAQAFVDALLRPITWQTTHLSVGASVGTAMFPGDSLERSGLMQCADLALYQAKSDGKGVWRSFVSSMASEYRERWLLAQELRQALDEENLTVMYQPQTRVSDSTLVGYEALVRWTHPVRGPIPPSEFIPLAEAAGLICVLGEFVLGRACADAALWRDDLVVSVNLSSFQIFQSDLSAVVKRALDDSGLPPHRLGLEITETALISDTLRALAVLERVKALGVMIVMDDFGTGYSSLSHLRSFSFDRIKIDRSFVMDLEVNPQSQVIVRAVCALAHGLGVPVTAEGVETAEQLRMLTLENCDTVQGYYLGRPQPLEEFAAMASKDLAHAA